jgi:hypothetical protein
VHSENLIDAPVGHRVCDKHRTACDFVVPVSLLFHRRPIRPLGVVTFSISLTGDYLFDQSPKDQAKINHSTRIQCLATSFLSPVAQALRLPGGKIHLTIIPNSGTVFRSLLFFAVTSIPSSFDG